MVKSPRHRTNVNAAPPLHNFPAHSLGRVISSTSSKGSAPSSVMCVPASALTRDLSDLSGSYMNGNTAPRSSLNRSFSVCSEEPVQGFWRQAHILSPPPPRESTLPASPASAASALIVVERNGVIELVKKSDPDSSSEGDDDKKNHSQHDNDHDSSLENLLFLSHNSPASLLNHHQHQHIHDIHDPSRFSRIPLLILLMDPGRKQYELMQLWVDPETDLVRDVLLSLQRTLSDKWRQDYDGLFQLRGNNYCQLLHILSIAKYDIRPRELWVAKPWSMAAKATMDLANDCLQQLRAAGLLSTYPTSSNGKSRIKNFLRNGRNSPVFDEKDSPLTLSEEALKRMYVPNGILKHHHAFQFLSFLVPQIPTRVSGNLHNPQNSPGMHKGFLGSLLGSSYSFDDASSQLSNPSDVFLLPLSSESPSKLNSSSSAASPSPNQRRHKHGYPSYKQQRLPTPINLNSKWQPSGPLEAVGEVNMSSMANDSDAENGVNVSAILADLETTTKHFPDHEQDQYLQHRDPNLEDDKKQRCSIWALIKPLNCAKSRAKSQKGDDGYSSSRGGDGSSGKNSSYYQYDGRDSPTSKGTGDGDEGNEVPFTWQKTGEENSIVSDSAPLLSRMPETSSICSSAYQPPQQPRIQG